jgi:hypothetical protein
MTFTKFSRRALVATMAVVAASTVSVAESGPAQAAAGWGAIAYSSNGANGQAWDYPTASQAGQAAINYCGYTDCKVLSQFTGCGAVATNGAAFQGGVGSTLAGAEARAIKLLGGGWIDSWACN